MFLQVRSSWNNRGEHRLQKQLTEKLNEYEDMGLSYVYEYEIYLYQVLVSTVYAFNCSRGKYFDSSVISYFISYSCLYSIDATQEKGSLGRLVNDSFYYPNTRMKQLSFKKRNHLCLFAIKDIKSSGEAIKADGATEIELHSADDDVAGT